MIPAGEINQRCAEAMGLKIIDLSEELDEDVVCIVLPGGTTQIYDPLHDDAQAMGLVKKFSLTLSRMVRVENSYLPHYGAYSVSNFKKIPDKEPQYLTWYCEAPNRYDGLDDNLNRAICRCVAKMQAGK